MSKRKFATEALTPLHPRFGELSGDISFAKISNVV